MRIKPDVPTKISIVETAIASGRYEICPDMEPEYPNIQEPMHNPKRDRQVPKWNPELFSYELPDGAAFFCDLLQSSDAQAAWESTDQGDFTKNELVEEIFSNED